MTLPSLPPSLSPVAASGLSCVCGGLVLLRQKLHSVCPAATPWGSRVPSPRDTQGLPFGPCCFALLRERMGGGPSRGPSSLLFGCPQRRKGHANSYSTPRSAYVIQARQAVSHSRVTVTERTSTCLLCGGIGPFWAEEGAVNSLSPENVSRHMVVPATGNHTHTGTQTDIIIIVSQ